MSGSGKQDPPSTTYFERSNPWWFSDFQAFYPELSRQEAGRRWKEGLESIINSTCEWEDHHRKKAQSLLNYYEAEQYFETLKPDRWNVTDFLCRNLRTPGCRNSKDPKSFLCDAWLRGLRRTIDDDRIQKSHRSAAKRLLNRYETVGVDREAANQLFDTIALFSQPASNVTPQPAILIHGSKNNATLYLDNEPTSKKRSHAATDYAPSKRPKRPVPVPRYLKEFRRAWLRMDDTEKWPLPPGVTPSHPYRYVEDLLYHTFKDWDQELAAHSWVIDTSDESIMDLFSDNAREMIGNQIPPLPELEDWFIDSIVRYGNFKNADELKDYLYTHSPLAPGQAIPDDEQHGRIWLDNVMRCWSGLLDSPNTFTRDHMEVWLTVRAWGVIHDQCMSTVPGSYMSRGESKSLSTSLRKNSRPPSQTQRQRVGRLYDGILTLDGYEVGAAEHSKKFESEFAKKWTRDTLKVIKVLHDMLHILQQSVSLRGSNKPQVQGVVTGGWHCKNWRMVIGGGYMSVLVGDVVREIPSSYSQVSSLLRHLSALWRFRNVLKACKGSINKGPSSSEELRKFLLSDEVQTDLEGPMIPRSVETEADDTSGSDVEEEGGPG